MPRSSIARNKEYVEMFAKVDDMRINLLAEIIKMTEENFDNIFAENSDLESALTKLAYLSEVAESMVSGFEDNGAFNG